MWKYVWSSSCINSKGSDELKLCCEKGTVAYYAYAARDIQEGEEITMDYGPCFFEHCPCVVCNPNLSDTSDHTSGKRASKSREEVEQEKQERKRVKRQRQKEKRKEKKIAPENQLDEQGTFIPTP